MAWSRDRSARGVLVQVVAVQAVLETAGRRAYCWRKAGGKATVLLWSGLSSRLGLVSGETDAGWGGEPAQVIAGGSDARSGSAQVGAGGPVVGRSMRAGSGWRR